MLLSNNPKDHTTFYEHEPYYPKLPIQGENSIEWLTMNLESPTHPQLEIANHIDPQPEIPPQPEIANPIDPQPEIPPH